MPEANAGRLESLVRDALRAEASGDHATAQAIASRAIQEGVVHPVLLRLQAEALALAGRFGEAGQLLNRALALAPRDAHVITDIGRVLVAEDRVDEAVTAFRAAVQAQPGFATGWFELGAAYEMLADDVAARRAYARAAELAPADAEPLAALAVVTVRRGDLDAARALAEQAIGLQPGHPGASLVLAMTDLHHGAIEPARAAAEALLARDVLDERQAQVALSLLGDALDRLGRTDEAFATYARMNELTARMNAARFGPGGRVESHLALVERLTRWFERQDPALWREPGASGEVASPASRHVFLLGYPRSGNTLVENILASLPGVRALEERPTLADADAAFLRDEASLDRLTRLDPGLADQQRAAYWRRVRSEVPDLDGKVFVDMSPLNGIKLQVIARLFPAARVVLCRRDPRDVVLSCFRRHFRVNASTYQMTSLEGAARHYDAVMRLVELHLGVLPLAVHVVDYAGLVADFEATTRALTEFVGVPWSEDVRNFSRTAAGREVRTVSAPQVRRGLFDGTRQWLRYRTQLEPVLPLLEPWVVKFGYETSAGPSAALSGPSHGS